MRAPIQSAVSSEEEADLHGIRRDGAFVRLRLHEFRNRRGSQPCFVVEAAVEPDAVRR
jgi:hypothetical protein